MKTKTLEIYRSRKNGQYGWRMIAKNGRRIAVGGETYHNKADLLKITDDLFGGAIGLGGITVKDTTTK